MHRVLFNIFIFQFLINTDALCQSRLPAGYQLADSLFCFNKIDEAAPLLQKLLCNPIEDSFKAEVLMRYGLCQRNFNKCDSGIYLLKQAAHIFEAQTNKTKLSRAYCNIGNLYQYKREFPEALSYFKDALKIAQLEIDSIRPLIGICVLQLMQENYDTAFFIIKNQLVHFKENIVPFQDYYIKQGQGRYFLSVNNYDSALFYLKKALIVSPEIRYKALVLNDIAETYRGMKDYKNAFLYQDSSSMINGANALAENLQSEYDTYANLYKETGNYEKALYYANKGRELSDSFFNVNQSNTRLDAEKKYRTKEIEVQKDLAEKDRIISQRNFIFSVVALGLVALLAFFALRNTRIKQKANTLLTQQKQQVQQLADQLAVANDTKARLFSTIGHDLRSPVSSLYASLKMQELKGNAAGSEMSEQTVRLLDTLEELLIWSKSQMDGFKVQPVKVNVRYFFEDLREFYSNAADVKKITIINDTAKDVIIRTDENLLKTIFRNAISNAITNTAPGNPIYLQAVITEEKSICISVQNPCTPESFQKLKESFDDAVVKSGAYGLGIVLMKEFAQKINAKIDLVYIDGNACVNLCI